MNITKDNSNREPHLQEIFISSFVSGRVKIEFHSRLNYTEVIELNSNNNFQYVKRIMPIDLASPLNEIRNTAIVISSEMDISVQANKAIAGSAGGYLALPITQQSVSFFLASYTRGFLTPTFSIVSPFDDTRISISYGNSSVSLLNLTMQTNDVYQVGSSDTMVDFDYTGVYVASSKPIAVFSGHSCANVPYYHNYCDYIVEQVPPVGQWGTSFIMASFYGRPWAVGYWIRVIAQTDTNVTYTYQSFDANNNPSTWSIFRTVTLLRGQWDEADLVSITKGNAIVVMVNCTFDCLVMQYGPGIGSSHETRFPDPFMVTVPALNHYPQNVRFSTSRTYQVDELDYECTNGVTIVAKTDDINMSKIYLDGISLTSIGKFMHAWIHAHLHTFIPCISTYMYMHINTYLHASCANVLFLLLISLGLHVANGIRTIPPDIPFPPGHFPRMN